MKPAEDASQLWHDRILARSWLLLAVSSLVVAGLFALLLVIGRMPPFSGWLTDPLLFKRGLVVHVDLALVVWFYAFVGALYFLLPARRTSRALARGGWALSAAGVVALIASTLSASEPVLANYIPVLDHPLALGGLAAFALGLALTFLDGRLLLGREAANGVLPGLPDAARPALRAAALAFLLACATFAAGVSSTPGDLAPQPRYELAFWGGGHVLQFASELGMASAWLILLTSALGRAPLERRWAALLCGLLVLPLLPAPLLALSPESGEQRAAFTRLMQLGIFPAMTALGAACLWAMAAAWRDGRLRPRDLLRDHRLSGFVVSLGLTALGFVLGALIRGPNTMVPAHYHASIGGVTASFMAVSYVLLEALGLAPTPRLAALRAWQPALFGGGQMVFATGFALAGAAGMARKTYAAEQAIRSQQEWIGLVVMGLGGLVAVAGGLLFLAIVVSALLRRSPQPLSARWRSPWPTSPSTPFNA